MLHYRHGNIVVIGERELHGSSARSISLLTGIPLNAAFSYGITGNGDGTFAPSATYNGQTRTSTAQAVPAFLGIDQRFQAGNYQQASTSSDGGSVTFHTLTAS